jgi:hypothetical protein
MGTGTSCSSPGTYVPLSVRGIARRRAIFAAKDLCTTVSPGWTKYTPDAFVPQNGDLAVISTGT